MPEGKWVFVFVPGAGNGVEAIKKPPHGFWGGRIISLHTGRHITQATHWRPLFVPPGRWRPDDLHVYEGQGQ